MLQVSSEILKIITILAQMIPNWQILQVHDLSDGTNILSTDFISAPTELDIIVNWNLNKIGALTKIPGYTARGNVPSGVTEVLGLTNYYYSTGQAQLAVLGKAASADIYIFNPATNTWTAQSQNLTSGARTHFATFLDKLFMVNGNDTNRVYDGSTWSENGSVLNSPKAKYVVNYMSRLYLLNLVGYPSRFLTSTVADFTNAISWDTSSTGPYGDVSPQDGDEIMGGIINFNRLLIFKEKTLFRYDTNGLFQFPVAPGTTSPESIQNCLDFTLYFHPTGIWSIKGNYYIGANAVEKVSRPIQPIIEGVSSQFLDKICAWVDGDHYYCYLGDISNPEANIYITNCIVDLDVARGKWRVGSLSVAPHVASTYRDDRSATTYDDATVTYDSTNKTYDGLVSAQNFVNIGDSLGQVYLFDNSLTFNGTTINSYFETHNYYPAGVHARMQLQALKIYSYKGRRCRFFYSVDDGPWQPIVKYEYRNGEIFYTFPQSQINNRVKLKCVDNSTGDRPQIKGFDIFWTPVQII
jgi:hypothetical protein